MNPIIKMIYLWKLENLSKLTRPIYFDREAFDFMEKYKVK